MKKHKDNRLFKNTSIVTGLSIAERALGFLYRIVLSRFIGAEGMGIYQIALSHYFLLHTVGAGGIPASVSRFIARCNAEGKRSEIGKTVGAGLSLSLLFTLPICLFFIFSRENIFSDFLDENVFLLLKILLFSLPFSCLFEVIRASFWGEKQFLAPALLEAFEEIVTVLLGTILLLIYAGKPDFSIILGAKNATIALTVAYLFSFICATIYFFVSKRKIDNPRTYLKPLFCAAAPITAVRTGASLINSAVAVLFPALLVKSGLSYLEAMQSYGVLTGMALPVLFIPITLISGFSLVLMPELSEAFYAKNYQKLTTNIRRGVGVAILLSCCLIPLFFSLGADMGGVIYANSLAGELIANGCFLLLPMSVAMITTSILNSMGKEKYTFILYFISTGGMLLLMTAFTPTLKEYAYLVAMLFNFTLTAVCNLLLLTNILKKLTPTEAKSIFDKQTAASALLGAAIICLIGKTCSSLLSSVCDKTWTLIFSALLILILCVGWYFVFIFVPRKTTAKKGRRK